MRNVPDWFNIGSILHQYDCATRADPGPVFETATLGLHGGCTGPWTSVLVGITRVGIAHCTPCFVPRCNRTDIINVMNVVHNKQKSTSWPIPKISSLQPRITLFC